MFFTFKCFCCCKILTEGVELMAQIMPFISIGLIFYAFTLRNVIEIWLCLSYAVINLAANVVLLIGCRKQKSLHFLPWLTWVLLCITLSTTFAPVMIYAGFHIEFIDERLRNKKPMESVKFIIYGALLIFKTFIFIYFWSGVYTLFKEVRKKEVESSPRNQTRVNVLRSTSEDSSPIIEDSQAEILDVPPPYVIALQETKYSFQYDSPPSYSDAILYTENELSDA